MNEEEGHGLTGEISSEDQLIKQITALTTPNVIITRGERGCTLYSDERKRIQRHDVPGIAVAASIDATGCGDVFGAAYCAYYLATKNPLQAVEYANTVAAFNATIAGSTDIDRLAQYNLQHTHRPATVSERVAP
jgi:sugar/nucleoside kinase (ribokinase family)